VSVQAPDASTGRWTEFLSTDPAPADLVRFHTQEKMTLLARSRVLYDRLGRITAGEDCGSFDDRLRRYGELYAEAIAISPTRGGHADALQHLAGRLRGVIPAEERAELVRLITGYRTGDLPLEVPLERLRRHFGSHPDGWASAQSYLREAPQEPAAPGDG
jgi:uncharacterized protein YbgA (DUF1722 family)